MDALATGRWRFSADAGAAHVINAKAMQATSLDMRIVGDFHPCRMTLPICAALETNQLHEHSRRRTRLR
jgi:hypothetical protein